ncbi:alpha/beta hydrolase [Amycolatopsis sp. NPDC051371]|uniref:alpha/beta fold hydrolase n=1 Tax=Amycolatopsis sp. NPDC051371 TaxID=3155800 RepID=UPI0034130B72
MRWCSPAPRSRLRCATSAGCRSLCCGTWSTNHPRRCPAPCRTTSERGLDDCCGSSSPPSRTNPTGHAARAVPVQVLRGRHDTLSPPGWARSLADAAAHGSLVTVPGAHTFPATSGGLTSRLITASGEPG